MIFLGDDRPVVSLVTILEYNGKGKAPILIDVGYDRALAEVKKEAYDA